MAVSVNVTIVLSGEEYSIVEIPHKSSAVVIKQKNGLLQQVDMKVDLSVLLTVSSDVRPRLARYKRLIEINFAGAA